MTRRRATPASLHAALAIGAALYAGLACSTGPTVQQMGGLPSPSAGQGRIVFYMTAATEVPAFRPNLTLDGEDLGLIRTGTFFFVERAPGPHQVGVRPVEYAMGSQGSTEPVSIALESGETVYLQVYTIATVGMVKVTLTEEDPAAGQRDLAGLRELAPSPPLPP
jgi:hypothetical protein